MSTASIHPLRKVATYTDYRRALAAVRELHEDRPTAGLHLALTDFEEVHTRPDADVGVEIRRAVVPALGGAAAAVLGLSWAGSLAAGAPLSTLLIAVVAAGSVAAAVGFARGSRHGLPVASTELVPRRYEVRAADTSGSVEHRLASWWATGIDGPPRTPDRRRVVGERRVEDREQATAQAS